MGGAGGYVWDLDAKKWDLWKVMWCCSRRLLTGDGGTGTSLGGSLGRVDVHSDEQAQSRTGTIVMKKAPL